jgi:hypothetical protein
MEDEVVDKLTGFHYTSEEINEVREALITERDNLLAMGSPYDVTESLYLTHAIAMLREWLDSRVSTSPVPNIGDAFITRLNRDFEHLDAWFYEKDGYVYGTNDRNRYNLDYILRDRTIISIVSPK